jgi:DNA-binding XRE family transcriptional regulator
MDFTAVNAFGLTQSELAKVLGVSRVTVNLWMNGKMNPHRLHAETVHKKLNQLKLAIELNLIPHASRGVSRHKAIATAIKQIENGPIAA